MRQERRVAIHDRYGGLAHADALPGRGALGAEALLPSQGVSWEPIDERSARATLADGTTRVALTFTFSADAMIESVRAQARGRKPYWRGTLTELRHEFN